jgi:N-acylneuraminate cytidylyltransferase
MSRLAVIPARGGSKRIPRKNIRALGGKPVIAYTIAAAVQSGLFDRVVVTTDDEEIGRAARECGADVPFLRDADIADDHTPVSVATLDALDRLEDEGGRYAAVAQLMANCPLRTAEDVRNSCAEFERTGAESQISITRYGWLNPWWALTRGDGGRLEPIFADRMTQRSQDLPDVFCPTGAVWWAKPAALRRERTFHTLQRTGWEIDWRNAVDIDTEEDWKLAELLMEERIRRQDVHDR